MHPDLDHTQEYFTSSAPWLWEWREEGDVIAWLDGTTVSFRLEILDLLTQVAPLGLPRFGAIVLFIAASRSNWPTSKGRATLLEFVAGAHFATDWYSFSMETIAGLDRLHAMRDLFAERAEKAAVAKIVVERIKNRLSAEASSVIVRELNAGVPNPALGSHTSTSVGDIFADFRDLHSALVDLNRESIEQRLKTGLDSTVRPIRIELPLGFAVRQLIRQLLTDETLGGVARLALRMLAAIQLPRPQLEPEDLAIGGINDITNHGMLDRLLLSELVHDDLTLAVRIAMNEALYMRREPMARTQSRQSYVLIDSGLRMWGLPRVFAAAVGLAVASKADQLLDVVAWRAEGKRLVPIDFSTERGLTEHLAALSHSVHPGEALEAFAAKVRSADVPTEAMLITTESVLADREFLSALNACDVESWQIAVVQRDGNFRVLQRTRHGTKALCAAQIALEEILTPKSRSAIPLRDPNAVSLPAIYFVHPFPLRIPVPINLTNSWAVRPWGTVSLTKDGRLFQWDVADQAAREIATGLPAGAIHWCSSVADDGMITLVVGSLSKKGLYVIQLAPDRQLQSVHRLMLDADQPKWMTMVQGAVLVFFAKRINALDPATGSLIDACSSPHSICQYCRYFPNDFTPRGVNDWSVITFDGKIITSRIVNRPVHHKDHCVAICDAPGIGPIGITLFSDLMHIHTGQIVRVKHIHAQTRWQLAGISRDGRRILFRKLDSPEGFSPNYELVDVLSGIAQEVRGVPKAALEPLDQGLVKARTLRWKMRRILVDTSGQLALVSRKGTIWPIRFERHLNAITIPTTPATLPPAGEIRSFEELSASSTGGRRLKIARWPNGSVAILDELGLLHLRSSDETVPECTIVLNEGRTSGWVADGRCWGHPYFIGHQPAADPELIYQQAIEPFIARISRQRNRATDETRMKHGPE